MQSNRRSSNHNRWMQTLFVFFLFLQFLSPPVAAGPAWLSPLTKRILQLKINIERFVPRKVTLVCPHCQSSFHSGGRAECPWKSLNPRMARAQAKRKIKMYENFMYLRISIETILGFVFIYSGELQGKALFEKEMLFGAVLLGAVLFEISHFIGEDGPMVFGTAMLFTGFLLAIQSM
mmetsp:Transcript_10475/g.16077  ORF Transcript_10475/g.16077 Transcript_10475/m.16077 type:complete len:177 (+) Transcript_10475:196-726(+)